MSERMLTTCKVAFVAEVEPNKFNTFKITEEIPTFTVASNSVLLSTAAYIVKEFPDLPHPNMMDCTLPKYQKDPKFGWKYLSVHPLFDDWVEILENSLKEGNAIRLNQTLYLKISVTAQYCQYLRNLPLELSEAESEEKVSKIFGIEIQPSSKKIAYVNFAKSQIDRRGFEPYVNSFAILEGEIYNNEKIEVFNVLKNEIPSVEKLLEFDTVILPGSGLSVLGDNPEVEETRINLIEAYRKSQTLKILGICFGHQLISKSFGAKVVKRQRCKGLHTIKFNKDVIEKFEFLNPLKQFDSPQLNLSEHHEDFVTTLPEGFLKLGNSDVAENEGFVSENGRILTFQFHPEYCYPYTKGYVSRVNVYQGGAIEDELAYSHDDNKIKEHIKSCEVLRECMMNFI